MIEFSFVTIDSSKQVPEIIIIIIVSWVDSQIIWNINLCSGKENIKWKYSSNHLKIESVNVFMKWKSLVSCGSNCNYLGSSGSRSLWLYLSWFLPGFLDFNLETLGLGACVLGLTGTSRKGRNNIEWHVLWSIFSTF